MLYVLGVGAFAAAVVSLLAVFSRNAKVLEKVIPEVPAQIVVAGARAAARTRLRAEHRPRSP